MHRVKIETSFEAAHCLAGYVPPGHKCERRHGHSYIVAITIEGELRKGMLVEFGVVKDAVRSNLDHYDLNEVLPRLLLHAGMPTASPPTAEVISWLIAETVQKAMVDDHASHPRRVVQVDVQEGAFGSTATWVKP